MKNKLMQFFTFLFCLSWPLFFITQAESAIWKVTTTASGGSGSLRAAISQANITVGADTIEFDIPYTDSGYNPGTGTYTIRPITNLPAITDAVVIDGTTQSGFAGKPIIELTGTGITPPSRGLDITCGSTIVRGLVINGFKEEANAGGQGIIISDNGDNIIEGNFIGTDVTGTQTMGNSNAIQIEDSPNNRIGGTTEASRNIISGNRAMAIAIRGAGASGNIVQGNYIGTDITGTIALGNGVPISNIGGIGITGPDNLIGGLTPGAGNLISGNGEGGIAIAEAGATGNQILGNYIGVDVSGTQALPNEGAGVRISNNAKNNIIGGSSEAARNIISANLNIGISLEDGSAHNLVQGNFIGTDFSGTKDLGNGNGGIYLRNCSENTIGGIMAGARNVISGNGYDGVGLGDKSTLNTVQGNIIGTDVTGTISIGNGKGVIVSDSSNNIIGGTVSGAPNLISGNRTYGIILSMGSAHNLVQGNFIGTDFSGTKALGNGASGIGLVKCSENTIGGFAAGARNVISGNDGEGIYIASATFTTVQGNLIGTDVSGITALGNGNHGICLLPGSNNNTIGGTDSNAGNIIAFNGNRGVSITCDLLKPSTGNKILANRIFENNSIGIDLTKDGVTPNDLRDIDTGPNTLQNFPELISVISDQGSITITGNLNSTPDTAFHLEFFDNSTRDPSGYGEGKNFLGAISRNTNSQGDLTFTIIYPIGIPSGHYITATATDPAGNTSEFSKYVTVNGSNLEDAIICLKILTGEALSTDPLEADTDGDGKIGHSDLIYILQKTGRVR